MLLLTGQAAAQDDDTADTADTTAQDKDEKRPKVRHVNPGIGVGLAHMGATGPYVSRTGVALLARAESPIHRYVQLNFGLRTSVMYPERTAVMFNAGTAVGVWATRGFVSVHEWTGSTNTPTPVMEMGALFGYFGLTMTYMVVPILWVLSPLASLGETTFGPSLSVHSSKDAPNVFVEAGFGASMFAHPANSFGIAYGPTFATGAQLGKFTLATRWLVSPNGMNVDTSDHGGTYLSGAIVVGL